MVIIKSQSPVKIMPVPSELRLDSARCLRFVAPPQVDIGCTPQSEPIALNRRKLSGSDDNEHDRWEGVSDLCRALDDIMEIDRDTELLADKTVLELGYGTGLPATFALECGAAEVTVHSFDAQLLEFYAKPTMRRNNVPQHRVKYSTSDPVGCLETWRGKQFDVVLAPELLQCEREEFGRLHDILDQVLTQHGIALIAARTHYPHCSGSVQAFLELCKQRNKFDAHFRWTSPRSDPAPRKVIQLTRFAR